MKPYREQNYYEVLDVRTDASPFEIRQAFEEVFGLYQPDAIVSYSFFSETERREILARLEEAYLNLIDDKLRAVYDDMLIENGDMEVEERFRDRSKVPIPIYNSMTRHISHAQPSVPLNHDRQDAAKNPNVQDLLKKDSIAGQDLKAIRMALEVPLDRIAGESKIKIGILQAIEEDQYDRLPPLAYLKGFIKLYAQCLQVDDNKVVTAYMKHMKM